MRRPKLKHLFNFGIIIAFITIIIVANFYINNNEISEHDIFYNAPKNNSNGILLFTITMVSAGAAGIALAEIKRIFKRNNNSQDEIIKSSSEQL